jgi:hypothetical protein
MTSLNYACNLVSRSDVNLLPGTGPYSMPSLAAGSQATACTITRIRPPLNIELMFLKQKKKCSIHKSVAIHLKMFSLQPQKYLHRYISGCHS